MLRSWFLALSLSALAAGGATAQQTASPAGAEVYFIEPADGAVLTGEFRVRFGLKGMGIAPAGVEAEKTGHHHLLVDVDEIDFENSLPADENFRHFGGGQTETVIELPAGKHTLQLLLGDHNHVPHIPPVMSEKITVTVK
ncbi:MAG: DUF4399 domain-containing protein [Rhizobiaceae bacterium]|nr:MAG: DUF4399 domain-containing protein [Rhizobiaceae bacterium]CAG0949097.1 hypothetical protein RHIZO_00079 [Rhizobiaceae bacterium]